MTAWMWIVAGPNGAGKSSFAGPFFDRLQARFPAAGEVVRLNADIRTAALRQIHPDAPQDRLNLQAARDIDAEVVRLIEAGQSFVVETVLSSGKYRDDVEAAQARGYRFGLIYVSLYPPELSPLRVEVRVAKGGHAVDPVRAIERYHRSHAELTWFAERADLLIVFDNSSNDPNESRTLLASKTPNQTLQRFNRGYNPAVDAALNPLES